MFWPLRQSSHKSEFTKKLFDDIRTQTARCRLALIIIYRPHYDTLYYLLRPQDVDFAAQNRRPASGRLAVIDWVEKKILFLDL